jgi:hypothetical protein
MLPAKNNLAPDDVGGLAYRIEAVETGVGPQPVLIWESGRIEVSTADAMLSADEKTPRDEAKEFIVEMLNQGRNEAKEIMREAAANGVAKNTLYRAKTDLRVKSKFDGLSGKWRWRMPDTHQSPCENLGTLGTSTPQDNQDTQNSNREAVGTSKQEAEL